MSDAPVISKPSAVPKPMARARKNPTPEEIAAMPSNRRSYYKNREKHLEFSKKYVETEQGRANTQRVVRAYQQRQRDDAKLYREMMSEKDALAASEASALVATIEEINTQELELICKECEDIMGEMVQPKKKRASRKKKVVAAGTQTEST